MATDRFLSGIQPSGQLHLGNYFGAIKQHIENQHLGNSFYFIANYHAMTTVHDAQRLREMTFDVAATYLALGLDPNRSVLFRQSDIPEVTELTWLLMTATPMALLNNAVSYKDKVDQGISPEAGLFNYPVLLAADILAYDSTVVPVGKDQVQHIEITRDIAGKFNRRYMQDVFTLPKYMLNDSALVVPGNDGLKMSKSYNNTIPIFASGKELKKYINSIKTDSSTREEPKDPEPRLVFQLYALFANAEEKADVAERYRQGGFGDGDAKQLLMAQIDKSFGEARSRRTYYDQHRDEVEDILREGAVKARAIAQATLARARAACGL